MWVAKVMRLALLLGGASMVVSLVLTVGGAVLGDSVIGDATSVELQLGLSSPSGPIDLEYADAQGSASYQGVRIHTAVLQDIGWPRWLTSSLVVLQLGLMAGGLLWAAAGFDQIRRGQGLTPRVGRTLRNAGASLLVGELLRTGFVFAIITNIDRVVATSRFGTLPPNVTANLRDPLVPFGAGLWLALSIVVMGMVILQAAEIAEEHELTV